ncbi:MAG: rsgI [Nitrospirae bacterium]|nr:MAG: rsgI [Nitrospirota bacterium]
MKKPIYLILFLSLMLIAMPAFAGYKIILKNGRGFNVNNYTEADGKIRFYLDGAGLIELDKSSIESIKQTKSGRSTYESAPEDAVKKDSTVGSDSQQEAQPTAEKGEVVKIKKQDAEIRLREIAKKKEELKKEAEKLSEEKKKIEEDIRKEGRISSIREKREYERKISELSEKINKFNEEMTRLDQEQGMLLKDYKGQ